MPGGWSAARPAVGGALPGYRPCDALLHHRAELGAKADACQCSTQRAGLRLLSKIAALCRTDPGKEEVALHWGTSGNVGDESFGALCSGEQRAPKAGRDPAREVKRSCTAGLFGAASKIIWAGVRSRTLRVTR